MAAGKTFREGVRPMLLSEAQRLFLHAKEVGGLNPGTVGWYRSCLDKFIAFVGDNPVSQLNLGDGHRWVLHMMYGDRYVEHPNHKRVEGTIAIPALNRRIRAVENFSRYLVDETLTSEDVLRKLRQHRDTKRIVDVLTDKEKERPIVALEPDIWLGARLLVIMALLIDTGMRVSELRASRSMTSTTRKAGSSCMGRATNIALSRSARTRSRSSTVG
jgi:site-specific recombinase XerD